VALGLRFSLQVRPRDRHHTSGFRYYRSRMKNRLAIFTKKMLNFMEDILPCKLIIQNENNIVLLEVKTFDEMQKHVNVKHLQLLQESKRTITLDDEELPITDVNFIVHKNSIWVYIIVKKQL
jgi:hypothetical protein